LNYPAAQKTSTSSYATTATNAYTKKEKVIMLNNDLGRIARILLLSYLFWFFFWNFNDSAVFFMRVNPAQLVLCTPILITLIADLTQLKFPTKIRAAIKRLLKDKKGELE
jgi:hypothetical protein